MPRRARAKSSTGIYHIMIRGISRQTIFEDDKDYEKMLEIIQKYKGKNQFKLYGYCFMANHVHLLILEGTEAIALSMQNICSAYANCYNRRHGRAGHLFQDRYKSEPVEEIAYMLTVLRHIHQNPIKVGLTKSIADYKWTSYHEYTSKQKLIETEFILALFATEKQEAIKKLAAYMNETNNATCLEYQETKKLTDEELSAIILEKFNIKPSKLFFLKKEEQTKTLKKIKAIEGASIRQIARITGATKYMVEKA